MRPNRIPRRNPSPAWVQDLSNETLHSMAIHLRVTNVKSDLTPAQWWLFDRLVGELVFRRRANPGAAKCWCDLCVEPYINEQLTIDAELARDPRPDYDQ